MEPKYSENPGPGNYEPYPESTVNLKSGPRIGRELREKKPSDLAPGPGEYNSHIFPSYFDPKISFPHEKKEQNIKSDTPGPGRYYKPEDHGDGITY